MRNQNISYISLADVNLKDSEIRGELLKHIGNEFDSVIAADITDKNSGSKIVDDSLGDPYKGLQLGTRCATTTFLYSFSGGIEKGANINEIKRSATHLSIPSSIISEAVDMLREKLFYIQYQDGRLLFTNQPNLNRILLNKIENIEDRDVIELEKDYLKSSIKEGKLKTYLWPEQSNDIPDDSNLKLIILKDYDEAFIKDIIENKGNSKRINRNTIFFLSPVDSKKQELINSLKRKIALEETQDDISLKLSNEQKQEIKNLLKREEDNIQTKIREVYRTILIPQKDKLEKIDLGIPTYGFEINLTGEVFEKLWSEGIIIETIAPLVLKEKYLKGKNYVETKNIYENSLKTLGEDRILNKEVLEKSIREGVIQGLFGLGELKDEEEKPIYWKEEPTIGYGESEIIIEKSICERELEKAPEKIPEEEEEIKISPEENIKKETISKLELPVIKIPKGKASDISRLLNYLQTKFENIEIKIVAEEGEIEKEDYENKIKETLRQLGIDI